MKIKSLLVSLSLFLVVCNVAIEANNKTKYQDSKPQTLPLKFKPGTSSVTVTGSVKGYNIKDYKFRASGGQAIKIKLTSKNTFCYFNVLPAENQSTGEALAGDPRPAGVTEWQGNLPKDGEYIIRVYLVRAEARRKGVADYSLNVEIK